MNREDRIKAFETLLGERIFVMDGAMGTMVQGYKLDEAGYRGERLADHGSDLRGNNDILNLTRPEIVEEIHRAYFDAGADIVETNTFSATTIAQADYDAEDLVYELNYEGARLARKAADEAEAAEPGRICYVAGALGPTNRTASISPDVNDPGFRNTSFDELAGAYKEAARGLIDGGADLLLVETIFDTLNAKAALFGIDELAEETGFRLPLMISGTITDLSGRTLSGQTPEAFWNSVRHAKPVSVGLNCALGAHQLRGFLAELSRVAETRVSAYPNAGLPNAFGGYDETPDETGSEIGAWARDGLVNIVGGCCGTTPDHIRAIAEAVKDVPPRDIPKPPRRMRLSGLEPFEVPA